jgi:hypothetical protein
MTYRQRQKFAVFTNPFELKIREVGHLTPSLPRRWLALILFDFAGPCPGPQLTAHAETQHDLVHRSPHPIRLRRQSFQQRQCECLQIKPAESFGVVWIQAMPLDAAFSEFATASAQLALAEAGQRSAPVTIRSSATNISFSARFQVGHSEPLTALYQTGLFVV